MAKLFIVGFPRNMHEIGLVEMFSAHGTVNTVTIITDKLTGESKGFGFITMTDDAGAERAIKAIHGTSLDGRTISVRYAEEKNITLPRAETLLKKSRSDRSSSSDFGHRTVAPRPKRPRRPL